MTVHPVRLNGMIVGVPQTFAYFDRMQDRIIRFVADNSRVTPQRFRQLMTDTGGLVTDIGTLLTGEEAVREGIIDSVGGLKDALKKLDDLIEEAQTC